MNCWMPRCAALVICTVLVVDVPLDAGAQECGDGDSSGEIAATIAPELELCDRNSDQRISISDALVALQAAISPCLKAQECDADGDGSESVTDALAILQYAVALPVTLECTCIAIDECFVDDDCQGPGYPPGLFCLPYFCVECEFDTDCADGLVCDGCTGRCQPNP
jgi:hypothetical protein